MFDPGQPRQNRDEGQRPSVPRQQAGHMTAPDQFANNVKITLANREPSTNDSKRAKNEDFGINIISIRVAVLEAVKDWSSDRLTKARLYISCQIPECG